jgi:hypothetical protein
MQAVLSAPGAYYCSAAQENVSFSVAGKQDAGLWACSEGYEKSWERLLDGTALIFGVGKLKEVRYVGTITGKERLTKEQADQWSSKSPGGKAWTLGIRVGNIQELSGSREVYRQVMDVFREKENGKIHSCQHALSQVSDMRWQKIRKVIEKYRACGDKAAEVVVHVEPHPAPMNSPEDGGDVNQSEAKRRRTNLPGQSSAGAKTDHDEAGGATAQENLKAGRIVWNCKAKDAHSERSSIGKTSIPSHERDVHKERREVTDILLAEVADTWQKDMEWGYYVNGTLKACADARLVHEDGTCVLVESKCAPESDAHALGQLIKYRWCERQCGEQSLFAKAEEQGKAVLMAAFKQKPPALTIQMFCDSGIKVWWPCAENFSWLKK